MRTVPCGHIPRTRLSRTWPHESRCQCADSIAATRESEVGSLLGDTVMRVTVRRLDFQTRSGKLDRYNSNRCNLKFEFDCFSHNLQTARGGRSRFSSLRSRTSLADACCGTLRAQSYALQIMQFRESAQVQGRVCHSFPRTEEYWHATCLDIPRAYCLLRLWHRRICSARS
jgi:hypothetical protein